MRVEKQVGLTAAGPFQSSISVPAGTSVVFRDRLINAGNMALENICLLDIMPHIGDIMVLPSYALRLSKFDLPATGASASPPVFSALLKYNYLGNPKNPSRLAPPPLGSLGAIADPTTTQGVQPVTLGAFGNYSTPAFSFILDGGTVQVPAGSSVDVFVKATVPAGTPQGLTACNNVGGSASVVPDPAHPSSIPPFANQSTMACVTVADPCKDAWVEGRADECCGYHVMLNPAGGQISSIHYAVAGSAATVQSFTAAPCPYTTSPPNLVGTTSGSLNFSPLCAKTLTVDIAAHAFTGSGPVCIDLIAEIVTHEDKRVTCRTRVCFPCCRTETCCDEMSVKPFVFGELDLSGRTFTITNQKCPTDPICSVDIVVTPPPTGPGVNGGGLYLDGVWTPWAWPYSYIKCAPPANKTVQFNLGIDYTVGWSGTVTVTVHHCDGMDCIVTYGPWKATKGPRIQIAKPTDIMERASLRIYRLEFSRDNARGKDIRTIAIRHDDTVASIVAVTGSSLAGRCARPR